VQNRKGFADRGTGACRRVCRCKDLEGRIYANGLLIHGTGEFRTGQFALIEGSGALLLSRFPLNVTGKDVAGDAVELEGQAIDIGRNALVANGAEHAGLARESFQVHKKANPCIKKLYWRFQSR
jgi:hypothetical protein